MDNTRREFLKTALLAGVGGLAASLARAAGDATKSSAKLNIVLITADDMNFDSAGCCGGPIKDLTPNIDRLAAESMRFPNAYSTVAVCQPVRQIMHTGLYPHRNGSMGFFPLLPDVRTLNQQLHDAGYLISMIGGKHGHYAPPEKFCVDYSRAEIGRHPSRLRAETKAFIELAKSKGVPFFHHVNSTDPHRPFIGAKGAGDNANGEAPSRRITPDMVAGVPGFLEDIPEIRAEVAYYFTSVRRLDDSVGAVLKAIDESGARDNTLVLFYGGDHGMSMPYAKSNTYENSSRGNLIVRWPGTIKPGSLDTAHMVSTLDFTPTLLEAAGVPQIAGIDGRSFVPALKGKTMEGWDRVFTFYNQNVSGDWLFMRCIRTKTRAYIWNPWADGAMKYRAENMSGITWKAMMNAAKTNPEIKKRVDFYLYRTPEEFYDISTDSFERRNLIASPAHRKEIDAMRTELLGLLRRTGDPLAEAFAQRENRATVEQAMAKVKTVYVRKGGNAKKAARKDKAANDGE